MKLNVRLVARALVEIAADLTPDRAAEAAGAAVALIQQQGRRGDLSRLPRLVRRLLKTQGPATAYLEAPGTVPTAEAAALTKALGQALGRPVALETNDIPALLGGARLRVGDDRFDASLSGALRQVSSLFSSHS
jgi:F0F1-type ATP synthase delta subunit